MSVRHLHWLRNINRVPIDYAFRPRLRDRLTLRISFAQESGLSANVFHIFIVTHVSILTSDTSSALTATPSQAYRTLRYHYILRYKPAASVYDLAPLHFRRRAAYLDQ